MTVKSIIKNIILKLRLFYIKKVNNIQISSSAKIIESGGGIVFGNDVWIARGCAILKGSTIPDGCIIGANSVYNKKVLCKSYSILFGAPAKYIKDRI